MSEDIGGVPAVVGGGLALRGVDTGLIAKALVARAELIRKIREEVMTEGVHYGRIPGIPKPSLWKPGAEILALTFGISVTTEIIDSHVDDDEATYRVRATARSLASGEILMTANRVCSTREKKYRWRRASKLEYESASSDRRQVAFDEKEKKEILQVRQDVGSVENTILGMCDKRAVVAVVALATGASEQFTMDAEELAKAEAEDERKKGARKKPQRAPESPAGQTTAAPPVDKKETPAAESPAISSTPPATQAQTGEGGPGPSSPPSNEVSAFPVDDVKVLKTGKNKTGDWTLYRIDAGRTAWITFDHKFAKIAQDAQTNGVRVVLSGQQNARGDFDLESITATEIPA